MCSNNLFLRVCLSEIFRKSLNSAAEDEEPRPTRYRLGTNSHPSSLSIWGARSDDYIVDVWMIKRKGRGIIIRGDGEMVVCTYYLLAQTRGFWLSAQFCSVLSACLRLRLCARSLASLARI